MIRSLLQSVGAIVASLIVAMVLIIAVEGFGAIFHPFPPGADTSDFEVCAAHVAACPPWILAVSALAWGGTVFASTWVATRLGSARHPAHGIAIGTLLLLAAAFNMYMLPYTSWFEIVTLLLFLLDTLAAVKFARRAKSEQPAASEANEA